MLLGAIAFALTFSAHRIRARAGVILLAIYGAGFAIGEISELSQRNVGISAARWDIVLTGSVTGAVTGLTCATLAVLTLVAQRRAKRAAQPRENSRASAI